MQYRRLGLEQAELRSGPYTFLLSRGRVIGLKDTAHPGLVFCSNQRGGKDVKAFTRHLNLWSGGLSRTSVSQRWLDEVFAERRHMGELLAATAQETGQEQRRVPDRRHEPRPPHLATDRRNDSRSRWRSSRSA